jgi:N utilization substance protein B
MAAVDRNIMRVAVYEMLAVADIPAAVSINEAVELTKQLGDEKSPRFVNGILDRVRKELQRPAHDAGGGDKAAP